MFHPVPLPIKTHHSAIVSCGLCTPQKMCTTHLFFSIKAKCTLCGFIADFFSGNESNLLCYNHAVMLVRDNYEVFLDKVEELAFQLHTHLTMNDFNTQVQSLKQQCGITYFVLEEEDLRTQVNEIVDEILELRGVQEVPANVTTELGKMAYDKQNVHTQPVVKQTSKSMEVLLSQKLPEEWDMKSVIESYLRRNKLVGKHKRTLKDICKWYRTRTCRVNNDKLYAKMLDGLLVIIQTHTHKQELMKRFLEETSEAVGLCCEGHLSRLCNVMVGFDDRFNPEVPVKEILQQKMALIAGKDIPVEAKVFEAFAVFKELKIPEEEYDAWIDAF